MIARKSVLLLFISLFVILLPLQAQGHLERWNSIDIRHYRFEIDLNDSTDIIRGKASVTVRFKQDADRIILDLTGPGNSQKGMRVDSIHLTGIPCEYLHREDKLMIKNTSGKTGSEHLYIIYYHGVPTDGLIISENRFGDRTFFSDNWPDRARHWIPVVDHPSDKATVEFLVSAPEHYGIVSIGALEEEFSKNGRKHSHWHMKQPIPTKLMVIGVSPFAVDELVSSTGIPVSSWVYPQNREEGFSDFNVALDPLDFFEEYIAPYPYSKLANVQSRTRYGGMENASCIFYHERTVNGKRNKEALFAHEIAHQWFGDAVSEFDWHHIWLSEGFATYLTDIYLEYKYGREAMMRSLLEEKKKVLEYARRSLAPVVDTTLPVSVRLLNANSYDKGAWFLHMLRYELGDSLFRESLRSFYRQYQFRNALTEDFLEVVERTAGHEFEDFFHQWLYRPGHPVLSLDWEYGKGKLKLAVRQHQEDAFAFPLQVGMESKRNSSQVHEFRITEKEQYFEIPMRKKPQQVVLDPDNCLLYEKF